MEGKTDINIARKLFQKGFIGLEELYSVSEQLGIQLSNNLVRNIPKIPYDEDFLSTLTNNYILILGIPYYKDATPLTLVKMRDHFGFEPNKKEPCFYNQDWYINERFANVCTIEFKWYLVQKEIIEQSRGLYPNEHITLVQLKNLPSALLTAFVFFAYFILNGSALWQHDYLWCVDVDHNQDKIYTGRYIDIEGVNKNGFSVHRHLSIKLNYGLINCI